MIEDCGMRGAERAGMIAVALHVAIAAWVGLAGGALLLRSADGTEASLRFLGKSTLVADLVAARTPDGEGCGCVVAAGGSVRHVRRSRVFVVRGVRGCRDDWVLMVAVQPGAPELRVSRDAGWL